MKRTIYLNENTQSILGAGSDDNLSGKIARVVESWAMACDAGGLERDEPEALPSAMVRYRAILDDACPALTIWEWSCLCDVLNATHRLAEHHSTDPARAIGLSVDDSGPDGMAEKWGVDLADLARRIDALPYPAQCAVIEVVSRFWAHAGNSLESMEQKLRAAGAKISSMEKNQ